MPDPSGAAGRWRGRIDGVPSSCDDRLRPRADSELLARREHVLVAVSRGAIGEAWRHAADDLAIAVVVPGAVGGEECEAVIPGFGSSKGVAVVALGGDREREAAAAAAADGYYVSTVSADSYTSYDRGLFIATLNDWGWHGEGAAPAWYTGDAWGRS